jgi:hypothetical protein
MVLPPLDFIRWKAHVNLHLSDTSGFMWTYVMENKELCSDVHGLLWNKMVTEGDNSAVFSQQNSHLSPSTLLRGSISSLNFQNSQFSLCWCSAPWLHEVDVKKSFLPLSFCSFSPVSTGAVTDWVREPLLVAIY